MHVSAECTGASSARAPDATARTSGGWRLGHRPELDGLRGVAILVVIASHVGSYGLSLPVHTLGSAGVEMFFALSGFLITSQLVEEYAEHGLVDLRRFYGRRVRRLAPALLTMIVVVTIVLAASGRWDWLVVGSLTYSANWMQVTGYGLGSPLMHTWSLAIEEQFYLAWPLAFVASAKWRHGPLVVTTVVGTISVFLRFAYGGDRAYLGSDTQAASLLVGCALAILAHRGLRPWRVPTWITGLAAFYMFAWALDYPRWGHDVLAPTVVPVVTAAIIWASCSTPGGVLGSTFLRYVGARSYALYLWHLPLIWFLGRWFADPLAGCLVGLALSFVAAELSWRFVETPFLQTRRPLRRANGAQVHRPRYARALPRFAHNA
jgi:peptidoglycan/LPS O-acetylase OafA/YrhL